MRILFLTQRLPYAPNRGDRIRAYYLLREMSRFASVSLFSLIHDDEEAAQIAHVPFAKDVSTARITRLRNYVLGAARLPSRTPLTHSLLDAHDARDVLATLVAKAPPDVIVAGSSGMARLALEPPLAGRPLVLDMVDVDSAKWAQMAGISRGWRKWVYRREAATLGAFEAHAARRAATTLVVNDRERKTLNGSAPDADVRVVSVGIEAQPFTPPGVPVEAPVVVFCGVMDYYPNEEGVRWFAKEVWPIIRSAQPDARFLVVGASPTQAVRELGASDSSIEIAGRVPEVQPHLWRSAVSVVPLRLGRGLQTKVLEALAAGLPVVVTPVVWDGLPPEALPGCVSAERPAEFAEAVLQLLRRTGAERRQRAWSAHLEHMTWAERLGGLESILREAAGRPAVTSTSSHS